jgi:H+/Cl- antiporter ClcA
MEALQHQAFDYFVHEANPLNGLVVDKTQSGAPASIAATGLALSCYPIGAERGFITRAQAVRRTLATLRFFQKSVQSTDVSNEVTPILLLTLLFLKPAATVMCLGSGVPGGLFTPSLALGALLGGVLGHAWGWLWPGVPPGLFALVGAAAVLAATTHGSISAVPLTMELTGRDRSFILPLPLAVVTATVVARTLDRRSIYDARHTDKEVQNLQQARAPSPF